MCSVCLNSNNNIQYAECVKTNEVLKVLEATSRINCPGLFIKTLANNSLEIREMPFVEVKPLLTRYSAFFN